MGSLDDFPQRGPTHALDAAAELAFRNAVEVAGCFIVQSVDRRDYGSDIQLEALDGTGATNCRVHIQLKGTEQALNRDGTLSIGDVKRSNLNYLLIAPDSCYVAFHAPTRRLLVRFAEQVYAGYERQHDDWQGQKKITVRFQLQEFDGAFQQRLRDKALASHRTSRGESMSWAAATPGTVAMLLRDAPPSIKVPSDPRQAHTVLRGLYEAGDDRSISYHYDQFRAVLGRTRGGMLDAHMAEINLGMNSRTKNHSRLHAALQAIDKLIAINKPPLAGLRYSRANCLSALGREADAIAEYEAIISAKDDPTYDQVAAQCHKNLGTSYERTGQPSAAEAAYLRALTLDPDLPEARLALAQHYGRQQNFEAALAQLDGVIRRRASAVDRQTIQGWRAQFLFLSGDADGGLDVLIDLVGAADEVPWIWPWSANLVAKFGRTGATAQKALLFWRHYLRAHPEDVEAARQRLLCLWRSHQERAEASETRPVTLLDGSKTIGYREFADDAILVMKKVDDDAFWWDRIGHWAQADGDWNEAETCYRKAHALEPDNFDYCLGSALTALDRFAEAIPFLEGAARSHNDSLGWHQLGVAHAGLRNWQAAIASHARAIELDENDPLPWFDLGGAHWNAGDIETAKKVWTEATARFPRHPMRARVEEILR